MFNTKWIIASTALVSLTACSSMAVERKIAGYESAKSDLMKYSQHQVLAWNEGVEERTKSNTSPYKTEIVTNKCASGFRGPANSIMRSLSSGDSFSYEVYVIARDIASEITSDFNQCSSDYDAIAEYRFNHSENDEWITITDWVKQMRGYDYHRKLALIDLEKAREKDADFKSTLGVITAVGVAAAAVAAAAYNTSYSTPATSYTNPNRHWVNGYFRDDGTYVQGHWRTNPNNTCLDNLNGC